MNSTKAKLTGKSYLTLDVGAMFISEAVSQSEKSCTLKKKMIFLFPLQVCRQHQKENHNLIHLISFTSILIYCACSKSLFYIIKMISLRDSKGRRPLKKKESNSTCEEDALWGKSAQPSQTFTPPPLFSTPVYHTDTAPNECLVVLHEVKSTGCNLRMQHTRSLGANLISRLPPHPLFRFLSELHVLNPWFQRTPIVYLPFSPKLTGVFSSVE